MSDYVDVTLTMRVEASDCQEAIEKVEGELGQRDDLAIDWPTVERVVRQDFGDAL